MMVPILSEHQQTDYVMVYFYYPLNVTMESIIKCFDNEDRFKGYIIATSNEMIIRCPPNIPVTQLCMGCYHRKCDKFQYALKTDESVTIAVTHHYCSQCQGSSTDIDDIKEEFELKYDDDIHTRHATQPLDDPHKLSFQFQLLMHQAFMKHINPSLKIRDFELELIENEVKSLHKEKFGYYKMDILPDAFRLMSFESERRGFIHCYCNQLKREHEERKLNQSDNLQVHYFNFQDDRPVMNRIAKLINNGVVSPYEWMESVRDLKISFFDPKDIMKKLMLKKYPKLKQQYPKKFKLEFLDNNGKYGKWGKAVQEVIKADCDSHFRREVSKNFADTSERIVFRLLDRNGYKNRYKKEIELQKNRNHDNKIGTPDILFMSGKPLVININGEEMKIHWIDVKNFCFWITTKMRYKLWQQNHKYSKRWGTGMFVFRLGYVENMNIGNDVAIVSLRWLKRNIPNIRTKRSRMRKLKLLKITKIIYIMITQSCTS